MASKNKQITPEDLTNNTHGADAVAAETIDSELKRHETWLSTRFDFRYDSLIGKPFYSVKDENKWKEMDDFALNSILRKMKLQNLKISKGTLADIFDSDFSPRHNSIIKYFETISQQYPIAKATGAIEKLSKTLTVTNDLGNQNWLPYLKKWLVGCVASGTNTSLDGAKNHLCLVLCGNQGDGKSKWLNRLCPPDLMLYFFVGKIDVKNKDLMAYLVKCFLINIDDQLGSLNAQSEDELKNLLTTLFVKYRKSYGRYDETCPRIASFMGSVNNPEYLRDPTGSRRFLSFLVKDINYHPDAIDINAVWAEAYHLYKSGFTYWFAPDELVRLNEHNQQFQNQTKEEELLLLYFIPGDKETNDHSVFMSNAEILAYLQNRTGIKNLSSNLLGRGLKKHNFNKRQSGSAKMSGYDVIEIKPFGEQKSN